MNMKLLMHMSCKHISLENCSKKTGFFCFTFVSHIFRPKKCENFCKKFYGKVLKVIIFGFRALW